MKRSAFMLVAMLVVIAITCPSQTVEKTGQPGTPRRIDPLAMQMQEAVLRTKDIHKVDELLKQGVDINSPIGCGTYSPLDGAVNTQNLDMLNFLLAHGAKPQGRELARAAFINNPQTALDFVKALLAAGVDPNASDTPIGSALGCAAYQGNRNLVVLLLAQPHINVDVPDASGYTALMYAAEHGSLDIVELLLKAGANPNLKNDRGQTAAALAEQGIATRRAIISKLESKLE